jgi:hypothetical protein
MHIVRNFLSLSLSLSQIFSQSLDGQYSQPCRSRERQQFQPASTTNTRASVAHASSDVANHAANYDEHAASIRTTTNTTTPSAGQTWRILANQASDVLSLYWTNGHRWLVEDNGKAVASWIVHQPWEGFICSASTGRTYCILVGRVCWSPRGTRNYQLNSGTASELITCCLEWWNLRKRNSKFWSKAQCLWASVWLISLSYHVMLLIMWIWMKRSKIGFSMDWTMDELMHWKPIILKNFKTWWTRL